jgi:hypothetical protein
MDCKIVSIHLLPYHLATLAEAERTLVEAHLVVCTSCVKSYFTLKRELEASHTDRPSDAARDRLRDEVIRTFRPTLRSRVRRSLGRPVPLYQSLAAIALAALVTVLAPSLARRALSPIRGGPYVDTSRTMPNSADVY